MTDCVDPSLAGLVLWCPRCRAEVHAGEATWLDDATGVILAQFPPLCAHSPVDAILTATAAAIVPAPDRCAGRTVKTGAWCRARPRRGGRYCSVHGDQETAARA